MMRSFVLGLVFVVTVAHTARAQSDVAAPTNTATSPPSPADNPPATAETKQPAAMMFASSAAIWALMSYLEQNDADEFGGSKLLIPAFYWLGAFGTVMGPVLQALAMFDDAPPYSEPKGEFGATAYLLNYKKNSALTGQLQRKPKGLGLGWDFDAFYSHPIYGIIGGGALTYQQSDIDENDWVKIASTFTKIDLFVGLDVAKLAGGLTGIELLKRQRLRGRIGPSWFRNSVVMADEGSPFNTLRKATMYTTAPLVSALGYDMMLEAVLDFGYFGGASATFQRGVYPSLSFPEITGEQAAFIALVGFDDLRRGKGYTWQKLEAEWALPLIGYWGSSVLLGAQFTSYKNEKGTGVDNRGFSLGMRGQF